MRALPAAFLLCTASVHADSFAAFESGHVRPLALSPSRRLLFAVNTPDNRLEIFHAAGGTVVRAGEAVVGLEPVAVAARSEDEVFVVNHLSDSVSVVDCSIPERSFVMATLLVGDEPRDVVLGGPARDQLFVTCARRGQNRPDDAALTVEGIERAEVWVFDARNLRAPPHRIPLFCDTPRGLTVSPDGRRVYVAAFHSGNRTTVLNELTLDPFWTILQGDGFVPPELPLERNIEGLVAPASARIVRFEGGRWVDAAGFDWSPRVRLSLPDWDLFTLDATREPPVQIASVSGLGTILFNLAVSPSDGRVAVSNLESRNHVLLEPALRGHVVENRVTFVDPNQGAVRGVHLNPHIDRSRPSGPLEEIEASVALPLGLEFSASGERLYVAAFGSAKVAVLDRDGAVVDRIAVGGGPSGVALHESANRLYVMNRFDATLSVVDLAAGRSIETVPLRYNPEPPAVREGRPFLYDARFSGHGDAACASCHLFGDTDSLAWDLGDPGGRLEKNPLVPVAAQGALPLLRFHPLKGPMTTQSLRGLRGAGAMHWRGDRNGGNAEPLSDEAAFLAFRGAFQSLLGKAEPVAEAQFLKLRAFVLALRFPPNPIAALDGVPTASEAAGAEIFLSDGSPTGLGGTGSSCVGCHALPLGTSGRSANASSQSFKIPHLRNLYQKVGMFGTSLPAIETLEPFRFAQVPTAHLGDQVRGFGFRHDGSVPTLAQHLLDPLQIFTFPDAPNRSGVTKVRQLEAFLLAFATSLAPVVGQQVTLDAAGLESASVRMPLFAERVQAGEGDLVLHGLFQGKARGFLLRGGDTGELQFQSDRERQVLSMVTLREAIAQGGALLTATVVPPGTGRRIGIDRDEDGLLDGDEIELGSDPADPRSPRRASAILRGDCTGDGVVDISDAIAALGVLYLGFGAPPCTASCDANRDGAFDVSDPVRVLGFLFLGGPPPGEYPNCEEGPLECPTSCPADR